MQFAAARPGSARPTGRLAPPAATRQSVVPFSATQPSAAGQPGDKLLPLLRTPWDLVSLPGRVALGVAASLPEVLEKLPGDVERLTQLAQDPRSLEEKQAEVLGVIEDRVVGALQKGTDAESEVLGTVAAVLPEPLKEALPEPIKEALKPRSSTAADNGWTSSSAAAGAKPLATWTITSDDEALVVQDEDLPPMTPAAIAASQTAAEVMEVNAAVAALREQLTAMQTNTDPARSNMIKLNLREAEEALSRRLEQMVPAHKAVGDASVQAAIREAEALLADVKSLSV